MKQVVHTNIDRPSKAKAGRVMGGVFLAAVLALSAGTAPPASADFQKDWAKLIAAGLRRRLFIRLTRARRACSALSSVILQPSVDDMTSTRHG